jgi:hypothetical protein
MITVEHNKYEPKTEWVKQYLRFYRNEITIAELEIEIGKLRVDNRKGIDDPDLFGFVNDIDGDVTYEELPTGSG